jgi:hypothetical protein
MGVISVSLVGQLLQKINHCCVSGIRQPYPYRYLRAFTKLLAPLRIDSQRSGTSPIFGLQEQNFDMAATGELIRLINYVDDINTTLRRISASVPVMEAEERKRLAESLRAASSNLNGVLTTLEK